MKKLFLAMAAAVDARDVAALTGLCLLSYGLWLVWQPAAFIAPGALITWTSMLDRR